MKFSAFPLVALLFLACLLTVPAYWCHRQGWVRRDFHRDVFAAAALALLAIGFFWRPLFEPQAWIPAGGGDMASMLYPNFAFVNESLRRHELPLWNPLLFCGEPFGADIQTGILYPINLGFWLLNRNLTYRDLEWLVVGHFYLAGLFTYILLLSLPVGTQRPVSRLAALAGGVAYMFSDLFVTHVGNLNMVAVAAWLPLVFLFFHRAMQELKPGYAVAAGLVTGVAFLAGHIQPFLYVLVAIAVYAAFQTYEMGRSRSARRRLPQLAFVLLTFGIVSFGAIAAQFLPSVELSSLSVRSDLTYPDSTQYSLPPSQLISLLVPDFFGRGPRDYWGQWLRTETGYAGVFTLVAAGLAIALRRERVVRLLAALTALGLVLALGGYTVLQGWLYEFVPGFDKVRAPARFVLLFDFGVALLCGLGVDSLLHPLRRRERAVVSRVLALLAAAALFCVLVLVPASLFLLEANREQAERILARVSGISDGFAMFALLLVASLGLLLARQRAWVRRPTVGLLALALVSFDLISLGHDLEVTTTDPTAGYNQASVIGFLRSDPGLFRIDTDTGIWDIWQPNAGPLYGIQEVQGGQHPLVLATFREYWSALGSRSTPLYDLLNVKYIIGRKGVPLDFSKWELAFDSDPQLSVYRNRNFMPRAFVVHRSVVEADAEAQLALMHMPGFDPRETVVVEQGRSLSGPPSPSSAVVARYRNDEVVVQVQTETEGYLVLSDMYDRGWQATVDGDDAPVLRADFTFRAVPITAGTHEVRFFYRPASWILGGIITACTWLFGLVWGALSLWRLRFPPRLSRYGVPAGAGGAA